MKGRTKDKTRKVALPLSDLFVFNQEEEHSESSMISESMNWEIATTLCSVTRKRIDLVLVGNYKPS